MAFMKEVAIVFHKNLFSKLLSSSAKKDLEIVCNKADKVVSCGDSILIHWKNEEWIKWEDDHYVNLMSLVFKLHSENESDFHFLEWNSELNYKDQLGSYYSNPWKTNLDTGVQYLKSEKKFDLKIFF